MTDGPNTSSRLRGRPWWWPRCTICGRWMRFEEMQATENPAEDYWPVMEHEACRG